GCSSVQM
ncbi:putative 50S ribosomal protein L33, partial [Toxoplasma gondii VAND]